MPKAVAILEGDSTKLVDAISDAKTAMQKLEVEGRKLTDQLRDVADEADKAAGSLVNKIGGQTAIKAIAGVTAGFAAAGTALSAFSGSMSAFYATQGEKGAKAMADIDMALNKMQGELFTAVMGTDNLEEATQTLLDVIGFLTDAVNIALTPLRGLGVLVRYLADTNIDATRAAKAHADEMLRQQELAATLKTNYDNIAVAIAKNRLNVMALTGSTEDLRKAQIRQQMEVLNGLADQLKAAEIAREQQEIGLEVQKQAAENHRQAIATAVQTGKTGEEFDAIVQSVYAGLTQATLYAATEARKGWSKDTSEQLAGLGRDYQSLQLKLFAVGQEAKATATAISNVPRSVGGAAGAGAPEVPVETPEQKMFREMGEFQAEAAKKQAEASAKAYADAINAEVMAFRAAEAEKAAIAQAAQDKEKADELAAFEFRKGLAEDLFQVKSKLLVQEMVAGKNGLKVMADLARKAIGDAISAKGDEAMAQAAIYAASFNPMAIPMAAAGAAAYAAAAALGSSAKKASSSTPASAAPVQAAPVNTSFNLRVDAAFADGESIARQFATMQAAAQRRGLVPAGAY